MDELELQVMRILYETAHTSRGWLRGGVRGWVLGRDISELAGCSGANDALQRLRDFAWVRSSEVRDPGRPRRPMQLWRIAQRGEEELAARDGREPIRVLPPRMNAADERMLFLSRQAWACLSVLQRHPGPLRSTELSAEARRRFRLWIYPDDVQMLLKRSFAEREDRGAGRAAETWLAASTVGRQVRLADGRSSTSLVQLRLPAGASGRPDR